MGQAAPLPAPCVGVMGRVSRVSGEGGVPVLTMELGGTGGIRCLGDVAVHGGLLRFGGHVAVVGHRSGPWGRGAVVGCHRCRSGWLVVVVRGLVMPRHTVLMCNDVARDITWNSLAH